MTTKWEAKGFRLKEEIQELSLPFVKCSFYAPQNDEGELRNTTDTHTEKAEEVPLGKWL
jgi:hypothetical protein